jgi:Leucine-rich repeat (LRR) protein
MGMSKEEAGHNLKYTKYKSLESSNLEQIIAENAKFSQIPIWIRECHYLKELNLNRNRIKKIEKDELPSSLVKLLLKRNGLVSIDTSELVNLTFLSMKKN